MRGKTNHVEKKKGGLFQWLREALFPEFCVSCHMEGELLCVACHAKWRIVPHAEGNCFYLFSYSDPMSRGILQAWKYGFNNQGWRLLKEEAREHIPAIAMWAQKTHADIIVPVPLFYTKRNHRGFDQAVEIAEWFSALTGIPYERAMRRIRSTKQQAQKTDSERAKSYAQNPFMALPLVKDKRIILVDDVITTGATMNACEARIVEAGGVVVGRMALFGS